MKKGWVVAGIILGVVALLVIGLLIVGGLVVAARGGIGHHVMMGRYGGVWGMGLAGGERMMVWGVGLFLLLLFALLLGGAVLAAVWYAGHRQKAPGGSAADLTPLDILKKRYAGGEIDREEFERMKEELK
jgi:putative membrane protein